MPSPVLQMAAFGVIYLLFMLCFLVLGLAMTAVWIYLTYWTYTDAERRGMESPELWALIVLFGNLVGIIAYLVARE